MASLSAHRFRRAGLSSKGLPATSKTLEATGAQVQSFRQTSFNPAQNSAEHLDVIFGRVEPQQTAAESARQIRLVARQYEIDQPQNLQQQSQGGFGSACRSDFSRARGD